MTGINAEPGAASDAGAVDAGNATPTPATPGNVEPAATPGNSGEGQTPPSGINAEGVNPTPAANEGDPSSENPFGELSAEDAKLVQDKGFKSPADALKSYRELETKMSQGEHKKEGEKPTPTDADYAFERPENAEEVGYNDDFAKWFGNTSKELGADPKVAQAYHDKFLEFAQGSLTAQAEAEQKATTERLSNAEVALKGEWGQVEGPVFQRNMDLANRAIRELGLDPSELGATAKVGEQNSVADATFYTAMAKVGASMFAEDSMFGAPVQTGNPFSSKTLDVTAQGQIWKTDKPKAVALIRSLPAEEQGKYNYLLSTADVA